MKLLTQELIARFNEVGCQDNVYDPIVIAKFFNPASSSTWYATEYNPIKKMFYGYVLLLDEWNDGWKNFSLEELERVQGKFGVGIERDLQCGEFHISKVLSERNDDGGFNVVR